MVFLQVATHGTLSITGYVTLVACPVCSPPEAVSLGILLTKHQQHLNDNNKHLKYQSNHWLLVSIQNRPATEPDDAAKMMAFICSWNFFSAPPPNPPKAEVALGSHVYVCLIM